MKIMRNWCSILEPTVWSAQRSISAGSIADQRWARYRVHGCSGGIRVGAGTTIRTSACFSHPACNWPMSNNTAITLIGEFTKDDYQADFGTAIDLRGQLTAPIAQVNNHPQDRIFRHQYTIGADVVQSLSDQWYLTARARHFDGGYAFSSLWLPISRNLATNIYTQLALQQEQRNNEEALQLSITGNTGDLRPAKQPRCRHGYQTVADREKHTL